jgi:hypothetical protein
MIQFLTLPVVSNRILNNQEKHEKQELFRQNLFYFYDVN